MTVVVNDASSNWTEVQSGVPQGSITAGPGLLLFLIYVNGIHSVVKTSIKMFLDDTKKSPKYGVQ